MALADIKDAGILAGFTRWGWPWHGLISGGDAVTPGMIGATGQLHPQPLDGMYYGNNAGWLIDLGLPPVALTSPEAAYYAGLNMEWRNYALIAGGYVYGTYIGDEAYLHIDEAGAAWRITLAYAFPGSHVLRITATIERFGYLRVDGEYTPPAPRVQVIDVTCGYIELSPQPPGASGAYPYLTRYGQIQDVFTNGGKALLGVLLRAPYGIDALGDYLFNDDLFSLVELSISGSGGGDGSGLVLSASEVMTYTNLTPGAESSAIEKPGVWFTQKLAYIDDAATVCGPDDAETITITAVMVPSGAIFEPTYDYLWLYTVARYAYYDSAGDAHAIRFRDLYQEEAIRELITDLHISGGTTTSTCSCIYEGFVGSSDCPFPQPELSGAMQYSETNKKGFYLLDNDTVVDEIAWRYIRSELQETTVIDEVPSTYVTPIASTVEKTGALSAYIADSSALYPMPQIDDVEVMSNAFRSFRQGFFTYSPFTGTTRYLGLHKMSSKAVAFHAGDTATGVSEYGPALTPLGPKAVGLTPAESVNFAYQRKTGEYTFANGPICYV